MSSPQNGAIPPPLYLVSHRRIYAIPHFATYRAIIVRYPTKASTKEFFDTIAASIAWSENYRCWASKIESNSTNKRWFLCDKHGSNGSPLRNFAVEITSNARFGALWCLPSFAVVACQWALNGGWVGQGRSCKTRPQGQSKALWGLFGAAISQACDIVVVLGFFWFLVVGLHFSSSCRHYCCCCSSVVRGFCCCSLPCSYPPQRQWLLLAVHRHHLIVVVFVVVVVLVAVFISEVWINTPPCIPIRTRVSRCKTFISQMPQSRALSSSTCWRLEITFKSLRFQLRSLISFENRFSFDLLAILLSDSLVFSDLRIARRELKLPR